MPILNSKIRWGLFSLGALALVGCKFGNQSTTTLTGYDVISGYYSSLPQTITFHAQIGTGAARVVSGLVNQMPDFLKGLMGNPVMLYYDNPLTKDGSLRAHSNTGLGIPTKIVDSASTFGLSESAAGISSGCKIEQDTTNSGAFVQALRTSTIAGYSVRGTISFDYAITTTLIGDDIDCNALRASFKSCYVDNVGCSTATSSIFYRPFIVGIYGPLIDAGVMTTDEIGTASAVGYHAVYQ